MNYPDTFDVIILGGGPAGSCAALRLLNLGYEVALVEQGRFPRHQIGESLSPGIWNIFSYLHADHLLEKSSYLQAMPARVIWETQTAEIVTQKRRGPGVMVNRGELDTDLLLLAKERGIHLFQPAKFKSCRQLDTKWALEVRLENSALDLTANFILDARGRKGIHVRDEILTAPPMVAVWMDIQSLSMHRETVIEAIEEGWLWGSPLPNHRFRIMAFVDPSEVTNTNPVDLLPQLLSKSKLFRKTAEENVFSDIQTYSVLTYSHSHPWGKNYLRLGEAAFSLDPLSSTGVEKAMRFSLQAAIAVNTVLKSRDEQVAKSFYENSMIESIATHTLWAQSYYQTAWPGAEHRFWEKRSKQFGLSSKGSTPFFSKLVSKLDDIPKQRTAEETQQGLNLRQILSDLWSKPIALSTDLTYQKTACVVSDRLEMRIAVNHPRLNREMAYLEQVEIAPLLHLVSTVQTFGELIQLWSHEMSFEQASRMVVWLWHYEILRITQA
jgi:flavin-dependent dehydrogenase